MDTTFYRHYKNFLIRMLCDMICDTAIRTFMDGKPYTPLLTKGKVDTAMRANPDKAAREYYNKPTMDGGESQIVKWATIRRNERHMLPQMGWVPGARMALAFDPSRTGDNSILTAMRIYEDERLGICGAIVNCQNFLDTASRKKYKLDSNRQLTELRRWLVAYNGQDPDYQNIDCLLIDAGAGGGTSTYADQLLNNWQDGFGREHRGLIDAGHDIYEGYKHPAPGCRGHSAADKPQEVPHPDGGRVYRADGAGVQHFPFEWSGQPVVQTVAGIDEKTGKERLVGYELSLEEQFALQNIDLAKNEIANIHRSQNQAKTSVSYALAREKQNTLHDDRFYTIIMLAHRLYELRRGRVMQKAPSKERAPVHGCVSAVEFD